MESSLTASQIWGLGSYNRGLGAHRENPNELPEETQDYIEKINRLVQEGMSLTDAQIEAESGGDPIARSYKSEEFGQDTPVGLLQVRPSTAVDPGFINPDSDNYSKDLANAQEVFKDKTTAEVIALLEDPDINRRFGEAYRRALENTYITEKEVEPAALVKDIEQPKDKEVVTRYRDQERLRISEQDRLAAIEADISKDDTDSFSNEKDIIEQITEPKPDLEPINISDYTSLPESDPQEQTGSNFAHISTNRRVQFGAAREPMVAGMAWDIIKARGMALADKDKTYTEVLGELHQEDLEEIYQKFPEFRGVYF